MLIYCVMMPSAIMILLIVWAMLFVESLAQITEQEHNYLSDIGDLLNRTSLGHCGRCAICSECNLNQPCSGNNTGFDVNSDLQITCGPVSASSLTFWDCLCKNGSSLQSSLSKSLASCLNIDTNLPDNVLNVQSIFLTSVCPSIAHLTATST